MDASPPRRLGIRTPTSPIADVGQLVESLAVGHSVREVLEGERRFALTVKTAHAYDGDLDALRSVPLRSSNGRTVFWGRRRHPRDLARGKPEGSRSA